MENLVVEQDVDKIEEEKMRKRSRVRGRALLIAVNSILGFYFIFFTGQSIYKAVTDVDSDLVTLCDLSASKSRKLYESLFKETYNLNDYFIYGSVLNLSENKIDALNYTPVSNLNLVPVTKDGASASIILRNNTTNFNEGIDLASLGVGDYILTKDSRAIKLQTGTQKIINTIYTLPDGNGRRKEIKVYNYPTNPCLVIKVDDVKKLPDNYYDMVIVSSVDTFSYVGSLFNGYSYKWIDENTSLADVDSYNSNYVIKIEATNSTDEKRVIASHKVNSESFVSIVEENESPIQNYDSRYFIRELGGRCLGGLTKNSSVQHSSDLASCRNEYDNGKMVFIIESPTTGGDGMSTITNSVINFINTRRNLV